MYVVPVAQPIELNVVHGDGFTYQIALFTDTAQTIPFDLSTWFVEGVIKQTPNPLSAIILTFTCAVTAPATAGICTASLTPIQTAILRPGQNYYHDIRIFKPALPAVHVGVQTISYGPFVAVASNY